MSKLKKIIFALILVPAGGFYFKAEAMSNVTGFNAAPGASPGLATLNWTYQDNLFSGATVYIQYNTADAGWDYNNAQIVLSAMGPISPGFPGSSTAGVNVGWNGGTQVPAAGYYFRVWVGTSSDPSAISPGVSSALTAVNVPPATALTPGSDPATGAAFVRFDGSMGQSKAALDPDGNFYVAASTGSGVRLAKFSPSKALLWERFYGNPSSISAGAVAADAADVYLAGHETDPSPTEGGNIFLRKYDSSGNLKWHRVYHNPNSDQAMDAVMDKSGNVYVAGSVNNGSNDDIWLGKYDFNGNLLWSKSYNSPGNGSDYGYAVAVDKLNNVIVAGSEDRPDKWQGSNIWVMKYKADGSAFWTEPQTYNSPSEWSNDKAYAAAADNSGNVYVVGGVYDYNLMQGSDIWVGKYDDNGNMLWTQTYNGPAGMEDVAYGAAADNFGNIYVSGRVYDVVKNNDMGMPKANLWVRKYGPVGNLIESRIFSSGGTNMDSGYGIRVSSAGMVNIAAQFGMSAGVYYYGQGPVSASLSAYPGPYAGSVGLSWNYIADLPAGSSYYVQVSPSPGVAWSAAAANIVVSTQVSAGSFQNHIVGGLQASRDAWGNVTSPEYYFRVWTSTNGANFQAVGGISTSTAQSPYLSDTSLSLSDGSLNKLLAVRSVDSELSNAARIARDAAGSVYLAFGGSMAMGNGYALRKYDQSGSPVWTRFYNSAGDAVYDINALAVDASGNFYVAGKESTGPTVYTAFAAKINSDGSPAWARTYTWPGEYAVFFAVAVDTAGAVYAGGFESRNTLTEKWALLKKYSASGAELWTSTVTHLAGQGNKFRGLALYGGAVYAAGEKGVDPTDSDIMLRKYNQADGAGIWAAADAGLAGQQDSGYGVAADTSGYVYVAGSLKPLTSGDAWLGRYRDDGASGALVFASTYSSVDGDANFAVTYAGGYLYTAGYETRNNLGAGENIRVTKTDPATLALVWAKTFDNSTTDRAYSVIPGVAGNFYAGVGINTFPGLYQFSPPYFGLRARPGAAPASAEVYWTMASDLPSGSTYYVQYSTFAGVNWSTASAQALYVSTQALMNGSYAALSVSGLDAARNGAGASLSPLYYFRVWTSTPGGAAAPVQDTASSYPNTPFVKDSAVTYSDSKVFTVAQTGGWRNKMARDANGYLYTVSNWFGAAEAIAAAMPAMVGNGAMMLRKYNPDMSAQWTRFLGGAANETVEGRSVALDVAGNVYVAGTKGSWQSATRQDILLIKYDSAGNRLWDRAYDYAGDYDSGWGVAAGAAGVVYITGGVRKSPTDSDIFIGKINSSDGSVISSITVNGASPGSYDEGGDVVFDSAAATVYAVGSVNNAGSADIWVGKYNANLGLISSATINGASNGWDAGYGAAVDGQGNVYVAGSVNTMTQGNDILLAKYDSSLNKAWERTYNDPDNSYDTGYGVRTDSKGGVYVVGSESRWNIGQGENLFIRKYNDAGEAIWTKTFNASGSSYESGFDVLVDSLGVVYAAGSFGSGSGVYRYRQLTFSNTNPMLTVFVSSVSALNVSTPMAGTGIAILPFDETGGVNAELVSTGTTDSNGRYAARLPAGFRYFIGISTPAYKPTIKDQMMDPYGSFMVDLVADATRQYKLYPRSATEPGYTLNIEISSGLAAGDYAMAEVFYAKTGEKTAYGIGKSTALNLSFPIHNLPPAAAGVYAVNINISGKNKSVTVYMDRAFPSTSTYKVDMTNAVSMVGFEAGGSTVPPSFIAVVKSTAGAPLEGVRVELSRSSWSLTGCGGSGCRQKFVSYENTTDVNGRASFYSLPISTGDIEIRKLGYRNAWDWYDARYSSGTTVYREYYLQLATYTLTGVLKYNGTPLPNARVMVWGDWNWYSGNDSYAGKNGMQNDAQVKTGYDGSFTIDGLTDGNVRLEAEFMGVWRDLNQGNNQYSGADDVRVVISSDAAKKPSLPAGNQCVPGKVWVLDNSGACVRAGSVVFNMIPADANAAGALYGSLTFVTTYTVTSASRLEIPASSPVVVMAMEKCDGGGCGNQKLGFASVSGVFMTNVATYSITLSTGVDYWTKIYSPEWGQAFSFNDEVNMSATATVKMDFTLTKAGALKGVVKLPDGTSFKPEYANEQEGKSEDSPEVYWADIEADGQNVDVNQGTGLDEYGAFEFPNLAPGKYTIKVEPKGGGFRWPPAEVEDVAVAAGRTTEIKVRLEEGLVVQPQIFGLPELSTSAWSYIVIGVPSGFQMNQKNITEMFFDQPRYIFDYDNTVAGGWDKKYLPPGQYDFYLLIGVKYNPDNPEDPISFNQFANFIGRAKNVSVQKSDSNPGLGSSNQPIPVNILGAIGQGQISGTVKGSRIFTDADYERIFANFESEIMPLIPAVMLYDAAGDLRGFGHAMPDENGLPDFFAGVIGKNKYAIISAMTANPLRYLIWGVPPGRYTAVFANPNYPPVTKEMELQADETYNFDFDAQNILVGSIRGVVRSSATGEALENATVYLKHRTVEKYAATDSSGAFSFANLPSGIYRLETTRDGFVKAGSKTSLSGSDSAAFSFYLQPSKSRITGKIYLGKFPSPSTKAGIKIVAYDETMNVENPGSYLPKLEVNTDESGAYEITGTIPGHVYKISAFYEGKTPETLEIDAIEGDTFIDDIVLADIPPQITVKVRKSPDSTSKVDVVIKSPKRLVTTPTCKYSTGEIFDSTAAVSMALVPGPDNTYQGQFTVSSNKQYYTLYVAAGDGDSRMEKKVLYDKINDARTEQYIQDEAIAGGEISMDAEKEEYSGLELDAGALTTSTGTADYSNLVGGFFSALPNVRTVKTAKGNLTIESAVKDLMASEVYNLDLSNAQANKPFTLTLKYDKEKTTNTGGLRIYQYDEASGQWKEIPGNYTVDPMTGVLSVDVAGLESAYEGVSSANTPLGRKRFKMSAVRNGRYVPSAAGVSQTGKFAVFTAKPPTGVAYGGSSFEIYNMPNPFSLKNKTVNNIQGMAAFGGASAYSTRGTVIKYHLPAGKSGRVKFVIYNLAGEKVRSLDEGSRDGGYIYYSEWDGRNDTNQDCASGVYFMLAYLNGDKLGAKAHKMAIIK